MVTASNIPGDNVNRRAPAGTLPRENRSPKTTPWEDVRVPPSTTSKSSTSSTNHQQQPPRPSRTSSSTTPPSSTSLLARQLSSLLLIILLYTAAIPFHPFTWLIGSLSGTSLFDRLFGPILLLCAFYFQWRIASLRSSVIISIPAPGGGPTIRNGRVERVSATPVWVWRTGDYWCAAVCEGVLLVLAEWGPSEGLRRALVGLVLAGLWVVGFSATPEGYKRWAWEHIKAYLFLLVWDELRRVAWGAVAGNSDRRRARQARW